MTDLAFWWRLVKPVLKFLARFIPGREPEPSRLSKAIKEAFAEVNAGRFRHPTEPATNESKKPDANPPKVA